MQNYNLKSFGSTTTTSSNMLINEREDENKMPNKKVNNESQAKHENKDSTHNWKVKAIIDNRNFLIPVPYVFLYNYLHNFS